jgi:CBS domain-containing protein
MVITVPGRDGARVGAVLHHSVGGWPFLLDDTTRVQECTPGCELVLLARTWPAGEAEVHVVLEPRPDGGCEIVMREDIVSGPGRLLPYPLRAALISQRNIESLRRLAFVASARNQSAVSVGPTGPGGGRPSVSSVRRRSGRRSRSGSRYRGRPIRRRGGQAAAGAVVPMRRGSPCRRDVSKEVPMATTVAGIMTRGPEAVQADMTIAAAARRMRATDIGSAVVLDADRLLGILTDRDITVRAVAEEKDRLPRSRRSAAARTWPRSPRTPAWTRPRC